MFLQLTFSIIFAITVIESKDYIFNCDFEGDIEDCFTGRYSLDSHDCLIVPCSDQLNETDNCMVLTKSWYGGDCFTKLIPRPDQNFEYIVVEFDFLAGQHPHQRANNTGAFLGYEDGLDGKDFYWVATPLINYPSDKGFKKEMAVQIIELSFKWTKVFEFVNFINKVRFFLKPKMDNFRIILEDYIEIENFAGDFLINNLAIYKYDGSLCQSNCMACESFQNCSACIPQNDIVLYNGQCQKSSCLDQLNSFNKDLKTDWNGSIYKIIINQQIDPNCYTESLMINDQKQDSLQIEINFDKLKEFQCESVTSNSDEYIPFKCQFSYQILIVDSEEYVFRIKWEQIFLVDLNFSAVSNSTVSQQNFDLGTQDTIPMWTVQSSLRLCKEQDCNMVFTPGKTAIVVGQTFYMELKMKKEFVSLFSYNQSSLHIRIMGNGTNYPIQPIHLTEDTSQGKLIVELILPLVVKNAYLMATIELVPKQTSSLRRLIEKTDKAMVAQRWNIRETFRQDTKEAFDPNKPYFVILTVLMVVSFLFTLSMVYMKFRHQDKQKNYFSD